jgi:hypothetical protein
VVAQCLLGFIDRVHAQGTAVILDGYVSDPIAREYALANYFLISTGRDGIGLASVTPETWWSGYEITLGEPLGQRTKWQGLLRRDFANGFALVNEPGAPKRTVDLGGTFVDANGREVTSVTLGARQGAVLRGEGAAQSPETPATEQRAPADERAATETILKPLVPATPKGIPALGEKARTVLVRGAVKPVAGGGKVKVKIKRKKGKRYRLVRTKMARVGRSGRFRAVVGKLKRGRYRLYAAYTGSDAAKRSRSKRRRLVVHS